MGIFAFDVGMGELTWQLFSWLRFVGSVVGSEDD